MTKKQAKAIASAINTIKVSIMMRLDAQARGDDVMSIAWLGNQFQAEAILADMGITPASGRTAAELRDNARHMFRVSDERSERRKQAQRVA